MGDGDVKHKQVESRLADDRRILPGYTCRGGKPCKLDGNEAFLHAVAQEGGVEVASPARVHKVSTCPLVVKLVIKYCLRSSVVFVASKMATWWSSPAHQFVKFKAFPYRTIQIEKFRIFRTILWVSLRYNYDIAGSTAAPTPS